MNIKSLTVIILSFMVLVGIILSADPERKQSITGAATGASFNQDTHAARGVGTESARVDSQITLKIPEGKAPEIYRYLRDTYTNNNKLIKKAFPDLDLYGQTQEDISQFTDEYFETPNFDMYYGLNTVRHRSRINTINADDRKSGRELVQIKTTVPGKFDIRTELKFDVETNNKYKTPDGLHPLISLIDKYQREDFKKALTTVGMNPYDLKYIFTIVQTRSRVYMNWGAENFLSFSVDEGYTKALWAEGNFSSIDIGLVETVYTEADEAKREKMWEIRDFIVKDLQDHFPDLKQETSDKYNIILDQLAQEIPKFKLLFRLNVI